MTPDPAASDTQPAARPVCKECGARPEIPGVGVCLACLDGRVIARQATLDAGGRP